MGLIQLTREARQPGWCHSFRDVLPNPYEVYIGLEAGAASIRNFEPSVVRGLLQTEGYARETFRNGPIELDPDGVERLVEVRLARQEILIRDNRPRPWTVIDEAVIRRVVGGTEVMCGQLRYMADSAQHGKTTIQVVPYHVLLRIPVGTVAWEEIAFRGVLQAALRRVLAEPAATAVGSAVFGLWHIHPAAEALAVNRLAAGRGARITAVTAVAAGRAGAGALLREQSGSLAAPVLLHLAANCAAPLASALARPTDRRGPGRTRRLSPNVPGTSLP